MANANPAHGIYEVDRIWTDDDGHRWLHFRLDAPFDYDQVKALPKVMEYEGEVHVRTGWNSDRGEVYYRNHMPTTTCSVVEALQNVKAMMDTPVGRRKYASEFEADVLASVKKALHTLNQE